jgi:hypothetical protein
VLRYTEETCGLNKANKRETVTKKEAISNRSFPSFSSIFFFFFVFVGD